MTKLYGLMSAVALVFTVACGQTDAGITTAVKSKLAADDTVKAYQVDVTTKDKVVTLSGDVETAAQREHAITIARNTDGVRDVIDQLRVNPTAATSGVGDNNVGNDIEDSAKRAADALERGAKRAGEEIKEGAQKAKGTVTDKDRDSDNDGK